ncbi:MAG: hypothetical protein HY567_02590 [Candidatus Kerfeldbacteria bacterium]|nr:hypothetical protein [Candidatus Kerfeldbacteria bacterium]
MHVLIIGTGRLGRALHTLISRGRSGATVTLWNQAPHPLASRLPLEQLVAGADNVLLCIPSFAHRQILLTIKPALRPATLVISFSKGIEHATGKTMDQIFSETVPAQPFALVGGPMMAEELVAGKQGIAVVGSTDPVAFATLSKLFDGTDLLLEATADPRGVSLSGVLKNVYALAVGVSYGIGCREGACQNFRQRALQEMLVVGRQLGIAPDILNGPAGVGDFMTTSSSPLSRNRRAGERLGREHSLDREAESIASFSHLVNLVNDLRPFPILGALEQSVIHGQPPIETFGRLLPPP